MNAVIAQSDLVTAYGWGIDALWNGLLSGDTAIKSSDRFAGRGFISNQLAMVPDLHVESGESRARAMLNRLLASLVGKLEPQTTLILATTVCEIEYIERSIVENKTELAEKADPQLLLAHLKQMLGLHGQAMVLSSACASSSAALTQAASMIERDESSAVLVIACDAISEFVYSGFSTLLSLCDTPARPFDAHRCGLSLGEAAAWALVVSDQSPLAGSDSVAILGWSNTTDAIHMTAPDRAAGGLSRALANACARAKIPPQQIGFIAAHGTATVYNDAMELLAFRNAIAEPVPVFSIKGGIGHTLGAAGLTQILVTARAISLGVIPPTVGLSVPDANAQGWVHSTPVQLGERRMALSTNSGFGGVNTAILLGAKTVDRITHRKTASVCGIAWFSTENYGSIAANDLSTIQTSPPLSATREITAIIGRPIKYFARMTPEARVCLTAASLAMKTSGWNSRSIGIVSAGYDGCIAADQEYFRDYVAGGLSLGRANLFIYTLPTSATSEVAIALTLTGPTLHLQDDAQPVKSLVERATQLVENGEAEGMLAVFSDGQSAICFAICDGDAIKGLADFPWENTATQMCQSLARKVMPR